MDESRHLGDRVRQLRLIAGLGQVEFAERIGIANGSVSKIENGRTVISDPATLERIARVLDCSVEFLGARTEVMPATRPWLRAYADASKKATDQQIADCELAIEFVRRLGLTTIPDTVPIFDGDPSDEQAIEEFALEVRAAASLAEHDVVGNSVRSAERLGCVVLPMGSELGRHVGLSSRVDLTPVIAVSRPSVDPDRNVPGDRQRHTVAHELGHLCMHSSLGPPRTAEEAAAIERQAHRFAGAFLTPAEPLQEELARLGGRVTLKTLQEIKAVWGVAIKALVVRFRSLGVIDEGQARSLYKQISSRGWNRGEPVDVGNESAVWLDRAIQKWAAAAPDPLHAVGLESGLGRSHIERWIDWTPTSIGTERAEVLRLDLRRSDNWTSVPLGEGTATITQIGRRDR